LALALMVLGCLGILLASNLASYPGVLVGLFVLAGGITVLQVAANPLAAALGAPERSHFRLTLSQAFNSLGTVLGPLIGAHLFLQGLATGRPKILDTAARKTALHAIDGAFLGIAVLILMLAGLIWAMRGRLRDAVAVPLAGYSIGTALRQAITSRWTLLGGAAIFLYVGAEVSIGTQMALFLHDGNIWDMPLQRAGYYVSLYWLGAMLGRFAGSALLIVLPAARLLAIATAIAALLCIVVVTVGGVTAGYAALAVGLFNSIMFPTIFTLTLERSEGATEATSGFLCLSIIGGAFLPLLAGSISDFAGYQTSFIVPAICYVCLCIFALLAARTVNRLASADGPSFTAVH
ncbi:MAG: glucose/galactose MFS transporter, partial [Alphaproteobacteria bacterium]